MDTIVVNLFGAPGSGKSTGAAYIFSKLKMLGINAELITEFAKDKVWEESVEVFKNQLYIFGKQSFKMSRCAKKVDVIITDSPLLLSVYYNSNLSPTFDTLVLEIFNSYRNVNYFINRVKPYNQIGRFQNEYGSDVVAEELTSLLIKLGVDTLHTVGSIDGYDFIVENILHTIKQEKQYNESTNN